MEIEFVRLQSPKHQNGKSKPQSPIRYLVACYFFHLWYEVCVCIGRVSKEDDAGSLHFADDGAIIITNGVGVMGGPCSAAVPGAGTTDCLCLLFTSLCLQWHCMCLIVCMQGVQRASSHMGRKTWR
jgi:hypothetical protein